MRSASRLRRRIAASTALIGAIGAGVMIGSPTQALAGTTDGSTVTGPGWSIAPAAGGYQVTLNLDAPLPMVDDAPTIEVNGVDMGVATESADGTTLSILTSDADVLGASSVTQGWASGGEKATPTDSAVTTPAPAPVAPAKSVKAAKAAASAAAQVASATNLATDDGSAPGTYSYTEDDYDFGDQAIKLAGISGVFGSTALRGEMTGRVYLPTTGGERPTVILLHGRHTSCSGSRPDTGVTWPCNLAINPATGAAYQVEIPSYKGYDVTGQTLATHGYAVVSISADAINANDNQLAADYGAQARGQLVLDVLEMLRKANAGESVSYHDAALNKTVTLDEAFASTTADASGSIPTGSLTAADLKGRFDLDNVGLMGHSRGGEGVVSAVTLNQALAHPFGIKSVLPLAPVDFGRMTVADTPMLLILPYCDGDVSNQQGQHFIDDSRYAFDDDVLRSTVWVMGADHNFFNSVWTPGTYPYSTSDDWSPTGSTTKNNTVCSTSAAGNQRLTSDQQYGVGVALMSAWFRLTLGGEDQFLPMFDGSTKPSLESQPAADVRVLASAPASGRADIATFTSTDGVHVYGSATADLCASTSARTTPQDTPYCASANTLRTTSAMPHWTPASFAPNVPASPMTKFLWSNYSASLRVTVPKGERDATKYDALTFKTAPEENVTTGTDMTVTVVDGQGATWSSLVSAINPLAVQRMPIADYAITGSNATTLNKIVLQEVSIPVTSITGIDTTDIREVRFAGAEGADNVAASTTNGGVYLSDLALATSAVGTASLPGAVPTIGVDSTYIDEGSAPDTAQVAVVLSKPASTTVAGYLSVIGANSDSGKTGLLMQKVTFAPGQTCLPVTVPVYGDKAEGSATGAAFTSYKMDISNPQGVITGNNAYGYLNVREDDGFAAPTSGTPVTPAPAVGPQGDVCAEYSAKASPVALQASAKAPAPGQTVSFSAGGYRPGESVTFTDGTEADPEAITLGSAVANASGVVSAAFTVPATDLGTVQITAKGAGSQRLATTSVTVVNPTTTKLSIAPVAPAIGRSVTLTATVTGAAAGDIVTFLDGATRLGTGTVANGKATLTVPGGFKAGKHTLSATFAQTGVAGASSSNTVVLTLAKGSSTTVISLSRAATTYGRGATGTVTVGGADGGTVKLSYGGTVSRLTLNAKGSATFALPASLPVGSYAVTAAYSGTDAVAAGNGTATYRVVKAAPSVAVTAPKKVKKLSKTKVRVTVAGVTGAAAPSGMVTVKVGKVAKTGTLRAGKVAVRVKVTGKGAKKVTVRYAGDAFYTAGAAITTVKVKK